MRIQHNLSALGTSSQFKKTNLAISKNSEKLSSGLRINRASDDAAGLSISEKMRAQIRALSQAERNMLDGVSLVQTAEGAYQGITEITQRQKELIVKGLNGTYSAGDREVIDSELRQLNEAIDSIATGTSFNGINLLARDDYQVFVDRSSHNVDLTTVGPLPPTTTVFESMTHFWPKGSAETPLTVTASSTGTTIRDSYNLTSLITPITLPNGEDGYHLYAESEQRHTEKTVTTESTYERALVTDPRFKELDVKYNTPRNVFFQTKLIPNGTTAGEYPDFGGLEDRFTFVELDGTNYTLDDFAMTGINYLSNGISVTYEKDGIAIEKSLATDGSSFTAQFTIQNQSGVDGKQIRISTAFQPEYDGQYTLSSSSGVLTNGTSSSGQVPSSGTVFEISNDLVDYDLAFLSGGSYLKPDSVVATGSKLTSDNFLTNPIVPSWSSLGLNNGESMALGIQLNQFTFKMNVYRDTNETTEMIDQLVVTTTTEIKDMDYATAGVQIQTADAADSILKIPLFDVRGAALGLSSIGVSSNENAKQSLTKLDRALNTVLTYRSAYGAYQNRLEHQMNHTTNYVENLTAAKSRIRDTDMAEEMMAFTKNNIQLQSAQAMLAQANKEPQVVMMLLK